MSQGAGLGNLLIFALPVLLIVFMVTSQRRRQKQVAQVQQGLQVGDEVTTTSGLLGRISTMDERVVALEVASGVTIRFDRRAIAGPVNLPGVTPATGGTGADDRAAGTTPPGAPTTDRPSTQDGPSTSTGPTA